MTDTPKEIKDLQLKIWLSKPPGERLRQQLIDNDQLFKFWAEMKKQVKKLKPSQLYQRRKCHSEKHHKLPHL